MTAEEHDHFHFWLGEVRKTADPAEQINILATLFEELVEKIYIETNPTS